MADSVDTTVEEVTPPAETTEERTTRQKEAGRQATKRHEIHFHATGRTADVIEQAAYIRAQSYFGAIPFQLELEVQYRSTDASAPYDWNDAQPTASVRAYVPWDYREELS